MANCRALPQSLTARTRRTATHEPVQTSQQFIAGLRCSVPLWFTLLPSAFKPQRHREAQRTIDLACGGDAGSGLARQTRSRLGQQNPRNGRKRRDTPDRSAREPTSVRRGPPRAHNRGASFYVREGRDRLPASARGLIRRFPLGPPVPCIRLPSRPPMRATTLPVHPPVECTTSLRCSAQSSASSAILRVLCGSSC
jgi:hypothetical protein